MHQHLIPSLNDDVVAGLEHQKRFLHQWGFLAADFDFAAWIVHEPLNLARQLVAEQPLLPRTPRQATA
ncbi:hypothetical protein [Cellvibrio japonicus]|uniref:Desulfurizing enzyme n=1 Tax=Cellvibrio japonicus (strain Ueda107) TaxID=498211 RepID=B3PJV8_CELJU|nr:hypothetical protein [Cellvibrio japonicus]ACE85911.1 desulfurizing enzyme [Cellvibrio japonicus Ueda107]QEI12738.1 hypothetical protein FY117_11220 [Cellvibrio japonicus]QEI16312.1 hypothetical protein FY116_11225 [Cellvibrio japonicus]QEI19890.1 hypothetical protein FY115_11220 [Cellvibrio japonicus]